MLPLAWMTGPRGRLWLRTSLVGRDSPYSMPPGRISCPTQRYDNFVYALHVRHGTDATGPRIIRGKRCAVRLRLFQELATAIQSPYCLGENWDALGECLGGLAWLPAPAYELCISRTNKLIEGRDDDFQVFMSTLQDTADHWRHAETMDEPSHLPVRSG
jgi:hypothetical protein